jgi:hypothetical protein
MRLVLLQMKTIKNVLKTHFDISAYHRVRKSPTKYCTYCHAISATLIHFPNTLLLERQVRNTLAFY